MVGRSAGTWCPNAHCRAELAPGAAACPACGLALTGPDAERLIEVQRELGELWAEAQRLTDRLLPGLEPAPPGTAARAPRRTPGSSLSGQQLLLGLGAVLTLSAAGFFLFVVWDMIGPAGQLLAVSTLIGAATASSYAACRRHLTAAAETAAVLVAGLTVLVLAAAYGLGWLGVDGLDAGTYAALAAIATCALLLLADWGTPRGAVIRTYRTAAAAAFGTAPWLALLGLVPAVAPVRFVLGLLAVTLVEAAGAVVALRVDRRGARAGPPGTAVQLGVGALFAYAAHLLSGWAVGYDDLVAVASRVAVACVLLLGPVLIGVASVLPETVLPTTGPPAPGSRLPTGSWAPATALALAVPSAGILVTDLPHQALVAVTLVLAGASLAAALDRRPRPPGWRRAGTTAVALVLPVLVLLVLGLDAVDRDALFHVGGGQGPGAAASTAVAALWAVAATAGAIRAHGLAAGAPAPEGEPHRGPRGTRVLLLALQVAAAELAWALAGSRVLVEIGSTWGWLLGGLLFLAVNLLIAAALVRRPRASPGGPAVLVEAVLLLAAAAGALVAVSAADTRGAGVLAATLVLVGVAVLAYAALPGRLRFAYLGAASVSLGSHVLVADAGVSAVEATSLPLAALLAGIGLVQARRRTASPTMLVAGPALSVALVPTLAVAVDRGDDVRLALVTAAALAVLGVGLSRQWRAPVTAGAAVLLVVAATQGGPLVGQLPTVLVLGVAGAVLLGAGVAWERAVLAGRRVNAWYGSLR